MPNTENNGLVANSAQNKSERALSNWQRLSYGVGHVLNDLAASMWFSYLLIFLHEVVNFDNFLAGNLMLIGQVADALCTPFIGFESDRTRTGFFNLGKRKSWHLFGTICVMVSFSFLFQLCITCENAPSISQFVYYSPFVVIFQCGWASVQISHLSFSSELTPYKQERVTLQSIRNSFTIISNVSVYGIFTLLFYIGSSHKQGDTSSLGPEDAPKFRNLAFICLGIGALFSMIFYAGTVGIGQSNNKKSIESQGSMHNGTESLDGEGAPIVTKPKHSLMTWKDWLKEPQFYQIALLYMCVRLYINISQVYFGIYLIETVKLDKIYIAILPLFSYLSSFVASILAPFINKYLGRKLTFCLGLVFGIGSSVWFYLIQEGSKQVYGGAVFMGVAGSILLITSLSMTSDLIAANTESGAFVFGAMSFTDKLSNGIAIFLIQKFHPCKNCCPACNPYYRIIQSAVPAAALMMAFVALLSLLRQEIGVRRNKTSLMSPTSNVCRVEEARQCPCGALYAHPGVCIICAKAKEIANDENKPLLSVNGSSVEESLIQCA